MTEGAATMPRRCCSYCGERQTQKMAQAYCWWYVGEDRVSYKLHMCAECLGERWATILRTSNSTSRDADTCIACGGSLEEDDSPVYFNLYLPKQEAREFELDLDAACVTKISVDTSEFGTRLVDRGARGEGPRSSAPQPSVWDSLEL